MNSNENIIDSASFINDELMSICNQVETSHSEKSQFANILKSTSGYINIVEHINYLKNQTVIDPLTGLYNRRFFDEKLSNEIDRIKRNEDPFSLILSDIDNFKKVNDTYGHLEGDNVLKILAKILKECIRSIDIAARYGGEEFVIILPNADNTKGQAVANRILQRVRSTYFSDVVGKNITASLGLATYYYNDKYTSLEIVKRADDAMYQAKHSGKDRLVYPPEDERLKMLEVTQEEKMSLFS
jgi:diguanylate cyclase (GGDEF)-like protein